MSLLLIFCALLSFTPSRQQQRVSRHPVGNISSPSSSIYLNFGPVQLGHQSQRRVQQNTLYYPCINRCQSYRWTYRWTTANGPATTGNSVVVQPRQPSYPVVPVQPVRGTLFGFVFPPKQTPVTAIATTSAPTPSTVGQPSSTTTPHLASSLGTTSQQELPTPPPYSPSQNGAPFVPETIVRVNPCPQGRPLMNEFRNPTTCNFVVGPNGGCPEGYWCHTGSSYETTTCCPATNLKQRCFLPRSNGEGEDLIPRWYFDAGAHKCKRFLYKGMRGNANNFVTAMSCAESCETGDIAASVRNPCASGQPARDLSGEQFRCGTSDSRCPAGYFCHLGESPPTNVCCELSAAASDRCNLALRSGEGEGQLRRFFFNTLTRKCTEFTYRGTKGNENSFLSLNECRRNCEKVPNPCPVLFDMGARRECQGDKQCARGEWCHVGSTPETTACCPAASDDPCKLPLDLGQGIENLTRWYAIPSEDACSRECRPFQYRGTKGNQNNFRTKAECEATCKAECPNALNPCAEEELLLDPEGRPQRCAATGQCPDNYWCHIGANPETTVCCSGAATACALPLAEGFGNAVLSRWYFNTREGSCQKFTYKGIGGNQNNYVDYEECMNACPEQSSPPPPVLVAPRPIDVCGTGEPLRTEGGELHQCSPHNRCPASHFCHIWPEPTQPNVCCPKNGDPCEQPLSPGEGSFALTRFHFDPLTRRCRSFSYRGTRGNANNFLSAEDCEIVCQASSFRGNPCPQGEPLADDQNERLVCGGGSPVSAGHSWPTSSDCPAGYWCHVGSSPDTTNCCPHLDTYRERRDCDLPLELGVGGERLDRWYFDSEARACRRFWYKGLKGNQNNFLSSQLCQQSCSDQNGISATQLHNSAAESSTVPSSTAATLPNPCLRGDLLKDADGTPTNCWEKTNGEKAEGGGCPLASHYCHIGHNGTQGGCCPRSGNDVCMLPLNRGVPSSATGQQTQTLVRWHFDGQRCEAFDYAGTMGNENNFGTKHQCESHCRERTKGETINVPNAPQCPHGEPKWERGAMGERAQNCDEHNQCPDGYVCHANADTGVRLCCENPAHFCLQARDHGPCTGIETRFGYNPLTDTCVEYAYGGCGGTLNRFRSLERCTQICCRQYRNRRRTKRGG